MFGTVFGIPTHPLVVHAVVVFVPLAALAGLIIALWPAARAKYAVVALAIATVAAVSVPIATESGEHLEEMVPETSLVEKHTELGDQLLPIVALLWLGLAVIAAVQWYARRNAEAVRSLPIKIASIAAMVLVVLTAVGSGVQVVRIGHSGAKAAWSDVKAGSGAETGTGAETGSGAAKPQIGKEQPGDSDGDSDTQRP